MAHGRDKPAKEKRKPKKDKMSANKNGRGNEVLTQVTQHPPANE